MALDDTLRARLRLPAVCAPMFLVTGPELVAAACTAGIVGALPRENVRTVEAFDDWLNRIRTDVDEFAAVNPDAAVGPIAVNLATVFDEDALRDNLAVCAKHGVEIVISAQGNPAELVKRVHDWGGVVYHDVTSMRFAEKAIDAGVDGLNCIGAGGGGHSGTISHLVLIPKIRAMFDGVIVLAGAVSTGAVIRAAEVLGADLAYLGTRFIATRESRAHDDYKAMIVRGGTVDLTYTSGIAGVEANWMIESIRAVGMDPDDLPVPAVRKLSHAHLPDGVRPWKNVWSAGQGIELIDDVPSVAELVERLCHEYAAACELPSMAAAARR